MSSSIGHQSAHRRPLAENLILDAEENLLLLDVRNGNKFEISNIGGHLIPLPELLERVDELDASQEIVAPCKMGTRSAKAVQLLNKAGFTHVRSLTGGIQRWMPMPSRHAPTGLAIASRLPDSWKLGWHRRQDLAY